MEKVKKFINENKENLIIAGISILAFIMGCLAIGWVWSLIIIGIADLILFVPTIIKKTKKTTTKLKEKNAKSLEKTTKIKKVENKTKINKSYNKLYR